MMNRAAKLFFIICLVMLLFACSGKTDETSNYKYLSIDINPKVDIIFDENETVSHIAYRNDDAKLVYAGESWIGSSIIDVIDVIISEAVDTGYIDIGSTLNLITVYAYQSDIDNTEFQDSIVRSINSYLKKQAIGAVVMLQSDVDQTLSQIVTTYDVSYSKARLMLSYREIDPQSSLDELAQLSTTKLMDALLKSFDETMAEYHNQDEVSYMNIKQTIEEVAASKVQNYRRDVLQRKVSQPDLLETIQLFESDYAGQLSKIQLRNREIQPYAEAYKASALANYVVGDYVYESSLYELTYIVNYQNINIDQAGTFEESLSWTSKVTSMSVSSVSSGTWSVVEGELEFFFNGIYVYYEISAGRIVQHQLNGNRVTFVKVPSSIH